MSYQDFNERRRRSPGLRRRGGALKVVVLLLLIAGVVGGGLAWRAKRAKTTKKLDLIYATCERGTFVHEVNGKGSAESAKNVDVASQVEGSATIIYLIPEGTNVKKGDMLVELDSSSVDEKLDSQVVTTNSSRATLNSSRATLRSAEISLEEYVEGTFEQSWMEYENSIFEAEQTRKQNADSARFTERLLNLNYSTELQYEIDKVAEEKAKNSLEVANLKKMTLLKYTSEKQITSLMADIETARAKVDTDKNSYNINLSRENRYRLQSANCKIRAPQDGQVVYANQDSRRMSESEMIKEGSTVRQRQVLVRLPDKTQMQVKAMINEANISSIKVGMPAKISFDSIPNRVVEGEVVKVNLYPEIVWMSSAKDYVTLVKINEDIPELRSGLTAQVRIIADQQENVLTVPVQCVTEYGQKTYCVTYKDGVWGYKEVLLGASNEKQVVVLEGLNEGDVVVSGARLYRENVQFPAPDSPSEFEDSPIYQEKVAAAKAEEEKKAEAEATAAIGGPGGAPGMGGAPGGMAGGPGMGGAPGGMPGGAPGMGGGSRPSGAGGGMPGGLSPDMIAGFAEKIKSGDVPKEMLDKIPPAILAQLQGGAAGAPDAAALEEQAQKAEEANEAAATIEADLARDAKIAGIQPFFGRTAMEMQRELLAAIEKKSTALQARIAERQSAISRRQEEIELLKTTAQADESTENAADADAEIARLVAEIQTLRGDSDADPTEKIVYLDAIDWSRYVSGNDITREAIEFLSQDDDAIFNEIFPNSSPVDAVSPTTAATDEAVFDPAAEIEGDEMQAVESEYAAFLPLFDDWDANGDGTLKPTEFVIGFFGDRKTFQDSETDAVVDGIFNEFDENKDEELTADEIDKVATAILTERAEATPSRRGGRGGRGPGGAGGFGGAPAGMGAPSGIPGAGGPGAPGAPVDLANAPAPEAAPAPTPVEPISELKDATSLRQAIALYVASFDFDADGTVQKAEFVKGYHVVSDVAGKIFGAASAGPMDGGSEGSGGFGGGPGGPPPR